MYLSQVGIIFGLFVILVAIAGFYAGRVLQEHKQHVQEGLGRDYPQTLRHPNWEPELAEINGETRSAQGGGLNDVVDNLKLKYFDNDNYPYNDSVRLTVLNNFVPGYATKTVHDIIDVSNVSKLTDMGFYFIREIIPRLMLPMNDDDLKKTSWNKIQWSTSQNILTNDLDFGVNMAVLATTNVRGFNKAVSDASPSSESSSNSTNILVTGDRGSSVGGSGVGSNGSGGKSSQGGCNVTEGCNQPCPTSCIQAALTSLTPPKSDEGSATSASQLTQFYRNLTPTELDQWWSLFAEYDESEATRVTPRGDALPTMSNKKVRLVKTDIFPLTLSKGKYDKNVNDLLQSKYIDWYFDPVDGYPTQNFLNQYLQYRQGLGTLDSAHANKLTDMVFYAMETIVSGLATESTLEFKFSWAPLRELSERRF